VANEGRAGPRELKEIVQAEQAPWNRTVDEESEQMLAARGKSDRAFLEREAPLEALVRGREEGPTKNLPKFRHGFEGAAA